MSIRHVFRHMPYINRSERRNKWSFSKPCRENGFFESTMVKVAKNLERIAGALEKANELKERELALKEKKAEKKE